MPQGTPVERVYQALLRDGKDKGTAARIAQAQTGLSLATGKKPKHSKVADEVYIKALESLSVGGVKLRRRRRGGPAAMTSASNIEVVKSFAQVLGVVKAKGFNEVLRKDYPEFDPGQPRDDAGRWSDIGGGGGGSRRSPETKTHRQLGQTATNLLSMRSHNDAVAVRDRVRAIHADMRRLPETAWRDPTSLDTAWNAYLVTVATAATVGALGAVLVGASAGGAMIAAAHTKPIYAAMSAALMAVAPKTWSTVSYTLGRRYLSTIFPIEGRAAVVAVRGLLIAAGGAAAVGAILATAMALRYGYREIQSNGEYSGVSTVNRRLEVLDNHINALSGVQRSDGSTQQRRIVPYIQAGLAMMGSLVAIAGAAKIGAVAYRAAKTPVSIGAVRGWSKDFRSLWGGLSSDVARARRGARAAAAAAASRARRRP